MSTAEVVAVAVAGWILASIVAGLVAGRILRAASRQHIHHSKESR